MLGMKGEWGALLALNETVEPEGHLVHDVHRIIDLRSGRTLAAIQAEMIVYDYWPCTTTSPDSDPTILDASASPDIETTTYVYGQADLERGLYVFRLPYPANPIRLFWSGQVVVEVPEAPVVYACYQEVVAMLTPGSSEVTVIRRGESNAAIDGLGEVVLYEEPRPGGSSRLLQWSPAEGERPASEDIEGDTCTVGLGDRWVVAALGRQRSRAWYGRCEGFFDDLRFAFRSRQGGGLALEVGPKIVERAATTFRLATRGDFVAASVVYSTRDEAVVALARTTDGKVRRISAHEGQAVYPFSLAMDDRYLYVVETPGRIGLSMQLAAVYRYDLTQFDSLGE